MTKQLKITRRDHRAAEIQLPDGDVLIPRDTFAVDYLHVDDRTVRRMNLRTVYVKGFPYVRRNASLLAIADRAKARNEPAKNRRSHGRT
jgi:hypothetical protein